MTNDCICSNVPRIWRLAGVTRTVRLTVTKDGSPYDFTGLQTVLRIDRDNSDFHYEPQFTVEGDDNNIIVFAWAADKQPLGDYTIEVTVTDGSGNKDRVNWHGATGVRLVEYSNLVKGEDAAGVESDSELGLDGIFTMNGVGMDAYEEWLADGNEGSLHDYILWMQGPAREAAEAAEATMTEIQSRADDDHTTAGSDHTRAAADHTTATGDHTRAEEDHTRAISDHTRAAQDHTSAVGDHMTAGQDHLRAEADHTTAGSDHTRAESDHATAASDHSTAASDHTKAGQDSTRAGSDHDIAVADHAQAEADHTRAESDHTTAAADHTTAASDHTTASSDHTTAAADHTQAVADHAVMAGYDTRLTNVETDVTQLGQELTGEKTDRYTVSGYGANYFGNYNFVAGIEYTFTITSSSSETLYLAIYDSEQHAIRENKGYSGFPKTFKWTPSQNYAGATLRLQNGGTNDYTIIVSRPGLEERITAVEEGLDTVNQEINGETITYTRTANGNILTLSPTVEAGWVVTELQGPTISLYDASDQITNITSNSLPFVANKNYYKWAAYDSISSPTKLVVIKESGIKQDLEKTQGDITALQSNVEDLQTVVYETISYTRSDFKEGYAQTQNKSIGSSLTLPSDATPVSSTSAAGHLTLEVKKGDTVIVQYKSTSNMYCRAFIVLNASKQITSWANPQTNVSGDITYNTFALPLKIRAEQNGYILLQFPRSNYNDNESLSVTYRKVNEGEISDVNGVDVCLPDTIYAVVGDTLQLYYRSIYRCVDFVGYAVKVVCDIGAQYPRYYEVTPSADNIGEHPITFAIKDNNNNLLGTKSVNLKVVAVGGNPISELNVLCLGASGTQGGQWASEFKRRLVGTGGTPSGSGKANIQFVGRKNVIFDGKQVNLEATGGYYFPSYTNTNTARYRFDVTAENEPTINIDDVYSNNGNNYTVKEINITAGEGGYFSCEGTGVPQSSGTLTKVSGSGSETIIYSSTSFSGNPFVYDGVIDMQQYADDYCNPHGATHGRIDVVYTELFGNGTSVYMDDFTTRMSQMQTFINQVRAVFSNCKFCIGLFWNPDIRGGMGVNYGASGTWSDPYGIKYSNMNLCNALQKYITDNNLSDYVFILNWLNEFDEENDMQQTTKKVNVRSTVTEIFGVNGVHPATVGYYQMSDTAWRLFVAKFCQSN